MRWSLVVVTAVVAGTAPWLAPAGSEVGAPERWVARDIGTLGGSDAVATAIDERGRVVGWSKLRNGVPRAFLWDGVRMRSLGRLGTSAANASVATAVNDHGRVVGYSDTARGVRHAFVWRDGRMRDLGPAGLSSEALGINDRGQIVGSAYPPGAPERSRAVVWERGRMRYLGGLPVPSAARAVNDRGQIVGGWGLHVGGDALDPGLELWEHAFLWDGGTVREVPGGERLHLSAIGRQGLVVSTVYGDGSPAGRGFAWKGGAIELLGLLPHSGGGAIDVSGSDANAVDVRGRIVGSADDPARSGTSAVMWVGGTIVRLPFAGKAFDNHAVATALNEQGQVVGYEGWGIGIGPLRAIVWTSRPAG